MHRAGLFVPGWRGGSRIGPSALAADVTLIGEGTWPVLVSLPDKSDALRRFSHSGTKDGRERL
jgi:hypothetical protein